MVLLTVQMPDRVMIDIIKEAAKLILAASLLCKIMQIIERLYIPVIPLPRPSKGDSFPLTQGGRFHFYSFYVRCNSSNTVKIAKSNYFFPLLRFHAELPPLCLSVPSPVPFVLFSHHTWICPLFQSTPPGQCRLH